MKHAHRHMPKRRRIAGLLALAIAAGMPFMQAAPASAATLDRIRQAGKLMLGFRTDAAPFSVQPSSGAPEGYTIALCQKVADEVKAELGVADLAVEWVPVTVEDRFAAVAQGTVDIMCGSETSLEARKQVSFSIPIFPGGIAAMMRADAPPSLRDVLAGRPASGPIWRASPARVIQAQTFSVVSDSAAETWLSERLHDFQLTASVVPVESYDAGASMVLDGSANVLFGDRQILVETAASNPSASNLIVLDRLFTSSPIALAVGRNDDDFRLVVDRSLSRFFGSPEFRDLYAKWFGAPDDAATAFFRQSAVPD